MLKEFILAHRERESLGHKQWEECFRVIFLTPDILPGQIARASPQWERRILPLPILSGSTLTSTVDTGTSLLGTQQVHPS